MAGRIVAVRLPFSAVNHGLLVPLLTALERKERY
jgi:hypothetical protein